MTTKLYNWLKKQKEILQILDNKLKMEERTQKLLILAGQQGVHNEARDFGKIVQIIVQQYLSKDQQQTTQTITKHLTNVISRIPLKQHMYAGLTAKISQQNKDQSNLIIQTVITNLQRHLSEFEFYEAINVLNYLSELMNISLLNSLTFMNLLEDVIDMVENSNEKAKRFFTGVLIRALPLCIHSLAQKLFQDLKKFIDLLDKHVQNDSLLNYLKSLVNKGKIINFSNMGRIGQNFQGLSQFSTKKKLKIEPNLEKASQWSPIQYFNLNRTLQDELYKQFVQQQGRIHQLTIQQLIETFSSRSSILFLKLGNYLSSVPSHKQVYMYQFTVSTLLSKCLKSQNPIVEQALIVNMVNSFSADEDTSEESTKNVTKVDLEKMVENQIFEIFSKGQSLDFNAIINVANLISYVVVNLKLQSMKVEWDWERYLEGDNEFAKKRVLLLLTLEKIKTLNDNFVLHEAFSAYPHYVIPQKMTNEMQYKTAEDMEIFQSFQQVLTSKSPAQKVNQMIKSEHDYEIFLQALFRRTALSNTHLKVLMQRYKQVLIANKEHDWALINKIRNFWKKSYLNRQLYLQLIIKSEFVSFNSYANYLGQLKDKNEREMIWIKIELNQLNNLFGNNSKKSK